MLIYVTGVNLNSMTEKMS